MAAKHILLTGAGFSRNWGGWLADEAFEFLLGCAQINMPLRELLLRYKRDGGFEAALAELQREEGRLSRSAPSSITRFQEAVGQMFAEMDAAFSEVTFEFSQSIEYQVSTFLSRFDAIFTVNQDLLLERHYLNDNVCLLSNGRWDGWCIPGMARKASDEPQLHSPNIGLWVPMQPADFSVPKRLQPYFKLHGSSNWYESTDQAVMVVGGNKEGLISRHAILKFNYEKFWSFIHEQEARLMIVGYSFADDHINRAIQSAVDNSNLAIFIVDPLGIDVIDGNRNAQNYHPCALAKQLWPRVLGASRRPLRDTFDTDRVEHAKLMRFFQ